MSQQNQQDQKGRPQEEMDKPASAKTDWAKQPTADNKGNPQQGGNP